MFLSMIIALSGRIGLQHFLSKRSFDKKPRQGFPLLEQFFRDEIYGVQISERNVRLSEKLSGKFSRGNRAGGPVYFLTDYRYWYTFNRSVVHF